jgi:hypothetical protein
MLQRLAADKKRQGTCVHYSYAADARACESNRTMAACREFAPKGYYLHSYHWWLRPYNRQIQALPPPPAGSGHYRPPLPGRLIVLYGSGHG